MALFFLAMVTEACLTICQEEMEPGSGAGGQVLRQDPWALRLLHNAERVGLFFIQAFQVLSPHLGWCVSM